MTGEGFTLTDGRATGLPEGLVAEVAGALEWYGCDMGTLTRDAAARAILAARSWQERRAAEERAHARRRDDALRLHEAQVIADHCEARRRAREYAAGVTFAGTSTGEVRGTRHS